MRVRELFHLWRHTRRVVPAAVSAALFTAIRIPVKILPPIRGTTQLHPAHALPIGSRSRFGLAGA